jgi:hypothetical protein
MHEGNHHGRDGDLAPSGIIIRIATMNRRGKPQQRIAVETRSGVPPDFLPR